MNFQISMLIAFCLIGFAAADFSLEKEKTLLGKIFDSSAAPLEPEETLKVLRELQDLFDEDTSDAVDQSEQGRRLVVNSCVIYADVDKESCTQQRFNDFRYLNHHLAPYPNMHKFIEHYEAEQLALCKSVNPSFSVNYAEIDQQITAEDGTDV